jgi:hypothetical protein
VRILSRRSHYEISAAAAAKSAEMNAPVVTIELVDAPVVMIELVD